MYEQIPTNTSTCYTLHITFEKEKQMLQTLLISQNLINDFVLVHCKQLNQHVNPQVMVNKVARLIVRTRSLKQLQIWRDDRIGLNDRKKSIEF